MLCNNLTKFNPLLSKNVVLIPNSVLAWKIFHRVAHVIDLLYVALLVMLGIGNAECLIKDAWTATRLFPVILNPVFELNSRIRPRSGLNCILVKLYNRIVVLYTIKRCSPLR